MIRMIIIRLRIQVMVNFNHMVARKSLIHMNLQNVEQNLYNKKLEEPQKI